MRVQTFPDYHDIDGRNVAPKEKAIELGCFPVKTSFANQYFALFYSGRKPSFSKVMPLVYSLLDPNEDYTKENVAAEIKEILQSKKTRKK